MLGLFCIIFKSIYKSKLTAQLRLEGISGGYLVENPWSSRATYSCSLRTMSTQLLYISEEDFTTSLGELLQCSVNLEVKNCFLMFRGHLPCSVCVHCLWSCHWAPLRSACLHLLCTFPSGTYIQP